MTHGITSLRCHSKKKTSFVHLLQLNLMMTVMNPFSITVFLLIAVVLSGHIPEEELMKRRMVMDRERPYSRKLNKYLSCQVCQLSSQSMHKVMIISKKDKDKRHTKEEDLYTLVTETCNPWSNIGTFHYIHTLQPFSPFIFSLRVNDSGLMSDDLSKCRSLDHGNGLCVE